MNTKPVVTKLGVISGRDAFELKKIETQLTPISITLWLSLSTNLCSAPHPFEGFIDVKITFQDVLMYGAYSLDFFPYENQIDSSFDKIQDSAYLKEYDPKGAYMHLLLSAYDHVIEVVCKSYDFETSES